MRCGRCQGCMAWNEEPVTRFCTVTMRMGKCLNCGNREDEQILRQRRFMHPATEDRYTHIMERIRNLVARAI